jgi:colanic acid biosynthesis glycosyl transferase WcaI
MRILVLTQYFAPEVGASQARLSGMTSALREQGHELEVVTGLPNYPTGSIPSPYRGVLFKREQVDGVRVIRTPIYPASGIGFRRVANYASFALSATIGLALAKRPDLVYIESPPLTIAPTGITAARTWRVPSVLFVADAWPSSAVDVGALRSGMVLTSAQALERWAYRTADVVTAPTQGLVKRIESCGATRRQVLFLPNGVDVTVYSPRPRDEEMARRLGISSSERVILYAGTVGNVHGVAVALSAMARLRQSHSSARLLVVGAGSDLGRVKAMAKSEQIPNVLFVPPQDQETLARIWSLAEIGISTLRDIPAAELTRPVKVLAAMASGVPVAYSGHGEGARLVEAAHAGVVVRPESPDALAAALAQLLDDRGRGEMMGQAGRAYVEEHLTWRRVVRQWLEQLEAAAVLRVGMAA